MREVKKKDLDAAVAKEEKEKEEKLQSRRPVLQKDPALAAYFAHRLDAKNKRKKANPTDKA